VIIFVFIERRKTMNVSIYFMIIAGISLWAYRGGSDYSSGKRPQTSSLRGFRFIQKYIQASSIIVTTLSLNFEWTWLLKMYNNSIMHYCGLAISAIGTALFLWAKIVLAENFSPCYDAYTPFRIVKNGPYGLIRHPIYSANMLTVLGCMVASGSVWLGINVLVLYFSYRASVKKEENDIKFSHAGYEEYQQAIGCFFPKMKPSLEAAWNLLVRLMRPL
jgi:protein-S-isoprenylcysteine O-methyltransferase Ste14